MFGQLFVVFYCGPGHLTPLRHRRGLVTNAGRPTRDLNLCHPASYTALTRTKLVPAKESEGTISLSFVPRHSGEQTLRDVMQLIEVAKVSFQLETSS